MNSIESPKKINNYRIISKISEGGTSNVYSCVSDSKAYALKVYKKLPKTMTEFRNESEILSKMKSSNIIKAYKSGIGKFEENRRETDAFYILEEYAEKGELLDYIIKSKKGFDEYYARYIFKEIIYALSELHKSKIVHLDIKTDNILLDSKYNLKLCDFGFSLNMDNMQSSLITGNFGTDGYQPPEIIYRRPFDGYKADIFSLGITLFTIVAGRMPFNNAKGNDFVYQHYHDKDKFLDIIKNRNSKIRFSDEFLDLFYKMICFSPKYRISIDEILSHPWIQLPCCSYQEFVDECQKRENAGNGNDDCQKNNYNDNCDICELSIINLDFVVFADEEDKIHTS